MSAVQQLLKRIVISKSDPKLGDKLRPSPVKLEPTSPQTPKTPRTPVTSPKSPSEWFNFSNSSEKHLKKLKSQPWPKALKNIIEKSKYREAIHVEDFLFSVLSDIHQYKENGASRFKAGNALLVAIKEHHEEIEKYLADKKCIGAFKTISEEQFTGEKGEKLFDDLAKQLVDYVLSSQPPSDLKTPKSPGSSRSPSPPTSGTPSPTASEVSPQPSPPISIQDVMRNTLLLDVVIKDAKESLNDEQPSFLKAVKAFKGEEDDAKRAYILKFIIENYLNDNSINISGELLGRILADTSDPKKINESTLFDEVEAEVMQLVITNNLGNQKTQKHLRVKSMELTSLRTASPITPVDPT